MPGRTLQADPWMAVSAAVKASRSRRASSHGLIAGSQPWLELWKDQRLNPCLNIHGVGAVLETALPAGSSAQAALRPQNAEKPFQSRFLNHKRSHETTKERPADDQCFHLNLLAAGVGNLNARADSSCQLGFRERREHRPGAERQPANRSGATALRSQVSRSEFCSGFCCPYRTAIAALFSSSSARNQSTSGDPSGRARRIQNWYARAAIVSESGVMCVSSGNSFVVTCVLSRDISACLPFAN